MKITRRFTKSGQDVFSTVEYEKRTSRITNPDGSVVFEMNDAEIPKNWSQLATDIMVSKYFRKAGVPQTDEHGHPLRDAQRNVVTGPEKSARQVVNRLVAVKANGTKHVLRIVLDGGVTVEATADHLVYCLTTDGLTGRWVRVDALEKGHRLLRAVRDRDAERALAAQQPLTHGLAKHE